MAFLEIKNVRITGLATAVPKNVISIDNKGYDEEYIESEIRRAGLRTLCFALTPEHISGKRVNEA